MADHRVPSQQADHISANTYPHPTLHQSHGHLQRNPHVNGNDRQDVHWEVPQPLGNVVVQGEMQYPPRIEVPNYDVAHHRPPPLPVSDIYRCNVDSPSAYNILHSIRRFHTCTCIVTSELPKPSQRKHTILLQRSKGITMAFLATVLSFP
ncbi:hypothetical protein H4582DRAFT_1977521 [Lactarius indigo]|nr:hypothetical protein H4582DRAFT_1977521 [Lactarius indigo]